MVLTKEFLYQRRRERVLAMGKAKAKNVPLEMILELWRTNERPFQRLVNLDLKEFGWNITSEE